MEYLVMDAGAIIRGYGLELYGRAKTIVTVSEVIAEIRDSKSREILAKLPFPIEERVPSQESIKRGFDSSKLMFINHWSLTIPFIFVLSIRFCEKNW